MSVDAEAGKQAGSGSSGSSGEKLRQKLARMGSKETLFDSAKAGRTLVDDVVLPMVQKVGLPSPFSI